MHRPTRYQARWQVHVYSASHLLLSESDCGKCKSAIQTHPNALLLIDIQDIHFLKGCHESDILSGLRSAVYKRLQRCPINHFISQAGV